MQNVVKDGLTNHIQVWQTNWFKYLVLKTFMVRAGKSVNCAEQLHTRAGLGHPWRSLELDAVTNVFLFRWLYFREAPVQNRVKLKRITQSVLLQLEAAAVACDLLAELQQDLLSFLLQTHQHLRSLRQSPLVYRELSLQLS